MVYFERAAGPLLRPWVRSLWYCRAPSLDHSYQRVFPNGCIQIVINLARGFLTDCTDDLVESKLPAAIVVGARQRYELIATQDLAELAGIIVEPGGFAGLFRERADLIFENSISADDLWSGFSLDRILEAQTPAIKIDTLERLLHNAVGEPASRSALADGALRRLRCPNISIKECAESEGVSERRLSQVFREQVGMSPKAWCRIQRFQTAVKDLHRGSRGFLDGSGLALRLLRPGALHQ